MKNKKKVSLVVSTILILIFTITVFLIVGVDII